MNLWLVFSLVSLVFARTYTGKEPRLNNEPKFHLKYNSKSFSHNVIDQFQHNSNLSYTLFHIDNKDHDLICVLPNITDAKIISQLNGNDEMPKHKSERQLVREVVSDLQSMFPNLCVFTSGLNEGYWTYGYCFGDKVIQFHEDVQQTQKTGKLTASYPDFVYVLGRFDGSRSDNPQLYDQSTVESQKLNHEQFHIVNDPLAMNEGSSRPAKALMHTLKLGELCDLTGNPRSVEVIYRCDPTMDRMAMITFVHETRTCEYKMVVSVKGLCNYNEFSPVSQERAVDIVCNRLEDDSVEEITLDDLVNVYVESEIPVFPKPRSLHVDIQDFKLTPAGNGYFWGKPQTRNDIYDERTVVFYNGEFTNFFKTFSKAFSDSMEFKIEAPASSPRKTATWDDKFIAWYEVYDYIGDFKFVVKVMRVKNFHTKELQLLMLDPVSMTDQDGDPVELPQVSPFREVYNYEMFHPAKVDEVDGEIKAVTVGAEPEVKETDSGDKTEALIALIRENPQLAQQIMDGLIVEEAV